ncbi:MAG: thioesterase domain-containing protein [Chitinophagaceae bacterium]
MFDEKKIKLFCFPFAGGASSFYHPWRKLLPSFIDLQPYELPGRGRRIGIELCDTIDAVVDDIMSEIRNEFTTDGYALFGHSMGGLIVVELARRIKQENLPMPLLLFISGKGAPNLNVRKARVQDMDNTALQNYLMSLGGVSPEFFQNPELVNFFLPVIINDLHLVECYEDASPVPLDVDIITMFGKNEVWTDEERKGWQQYTTGNHQQFTFPGGHFFIKDYFREVTRIIAQMLHHQIMQ